ncbi:MAG TPA: sigma-70 family RNA polymerase sigma factor [Thermoanaerobaculia bacterium]|jgi:RNA polymerase sigma factor (sigma-70 family)
MTLKLSAPSPEARFDILPHVPALAHPRAGMSISSDSGSHDDAARAIAIAYRTHYDLLEFIGIQKFGIPDGDVADVIHEVVLAFIRVRARVQKERAWFVGAMCHASRHYWRQHGREVPASGLRGESEGSLTIDDVASRVDVAVMLRRLPRRCREVLRLRFFEEYSSQEIARHFTTTVDYARKMVYRCVGAARDLLLRTSGRTR